MLTQDPPPLTGVGLDPRLQEVVARALAKDRRQRWPDAGRFREALVGLRLALLSESAARTGGVPGRAVRRLPRVGLATLGALLAVVLVWLLGRSGAPAPRSATADLRTVAVLPFGDLSSEPVDRYLALSVPDEVTNVLARSHELAVRPFSETRRVDPATVDHRRLGRELGADLLVTGQLYLREGELSLTVEAIEAQAERVVWRESLTHPSADLIELEVEEGDVVGAIESVGRFLAHRPRSGFGHSLASVALRYGGLVDEAVKACERGFALDPRDPLLRVCTWTYLWSGDHQRTLECASRATSLLWRNDLTARIALMEGRPEEARRLWSRQLDPSAGRLRRDAVVSCLDGERATEVEGRFREELERMRAGQDPEWKFASAGLFVRYGLVEEGIELLRQAAGGGYCVDPLADPLLSPLAGRDDLAEVRAVAGECRDEVRRAVEPFIAAWRRTD